MLLCLKKPIPTITIRNMKYYLIQCNELFLWLMLLYTSELFVLMPSIYLVECRPYCRCCIATYCPFSLVGKRHICTHFPACSMSIYMKKRCLYIRQFGEARSLRWSCFVFFTGNKASTLETRTDLCLLALAWWVCLRTKRRGTNTL